MCTESTVRAKRQGSHFRRDRGGPEWGSGERGERRVQVVLTGVTLCKGLQEGEDQK